MSEKSPQELLAPALIAARTPAQMEALAAELERIAAVTRQVAQAKRRDGEKEPAKRARVTGGKGGRPSTPFIYVFRQPRRHAEADSLFVRFSRALYYEAGRPERLDPQRRGADLVFTPATGDAGYKVSVSPGYVKINASGARDIVELDDGRYAATVEGGAIVVGGRL